MKKTLAIVLALVMVLCMIPAMSADTYKTISDKSYTLKVHDWHNGALNTLNTASSANSITAEYDYEELDEDDTGKFTDSAYVAIVEIGGWDADLNMTDWTMTVDGGEVDVDGAEYAAYAGYDPNTQTAYFPVTMTKSGYTDTFVVTVKGETDDDVVITETAKVTIKLVNEHSYKDAKTATITNISSDTDTVSAYIVGSKIYLDYYDANAKDAEVYITFADENGKAFSAITYAKEPVDDDTDAAASNAVELSRDADYYIATYGESKLSGSKVPFIFHGVAEDEVFFKLETQGTNYVTKEYDIVVRLGVEEADPKGIYFAEATKTIAIGQQYVPTVMGVATGKPVDATLYAGDNTSYEVIDVDDDTVIGTREGVAYIYASYSMLSQNKTYNASSMKIVVTANAVDETIPPVESANTYKVTASELNVRKGPGTSYAKAGTLSYGANVTVEFITNGWAKLADGTYVSAAYLRKVATDSETTTMYVTCRTLNVRSGAGTAYSKVGTLSRNTAVEVVNVAGGWAELSDGTYVCYKYLAA